MTNCRVIIVKGNSKCHKILSAKAQKQNKILKRKEKIEFYVEEQKSKEFWVLIHADRAMPKGKLIEELKELKRKAILSE